MAELDEIRNQLISKILAIRNSNVLFEIDELISSKKVDTDFYNLTEEQEIMLEMSENDILNNRVISHQQFMENTTKWLKQKRSS